jgi:hypothetical protein
MKHNEHVGRANASYLSHALRDEAIREYEQEQQHALPEPTSFSEWLEQNGDSI